VPGGVDLLHLDLRIDVAVVEKVHVGFLNLRHAQRVADDGHYVVQREKVVALNLRVDVLAHGATSQELHKLDVILQGAVVAELFHAQHLLLHHLNEVVKRTLVVVEDQHILAGVDELLHHHVLAAADELVLRPHYGLQELQVGYVTTMNLDAVHEVLHHLVRHLVAQGQVVLEDGAHSLRLQNLKGK